MSWFKLDDQFPRHPKVLGVPAESAWLFVAGGCYCAQYLTDGLIPKSAITGLTSSRKPQPLVAALLRVGLWTEHDEHYEMHDYLDYNPTREQVEKIRQDSRERRANGGRRSAHVRANGMNPDPTPPEVLTEPLEVAATNGSRPKRGSRIPETFEVSPEMESWGRSQAPDVDWRMETQKFVNYWKAKPGKEAIKLDWPRTWQNWLLNAQGRLTNRGAVRTHL